MGTARHVACLLHARHHFTTAAAMDGSLKLNKDDGRRRVAYDRLWSMGYGKACSPLTSTKSAALEEAGILETDYDTHRRVGDGISGGALPPSWEVIDSELYTLRYLCIHTPANRGDGSNGGYTALALPHTIIL